MYAYLLPAVLRLGVIDKDEDDEECRVRNERGPVHVSNVSVDGGYIENHAGGRGDAG